MQITETKIKVSELCQGYTDDGDGGKANGNPVVQGKSVKGNFLYNPVTKEYVHSVYARVLIRKKVGA